MKAPNVLICRCSPTQKTEMMKLLREHTKKVVAAVGDGDNDVGMLNEADLGICVTDKDES